MQPSALPHFPASPEDTDRGIWAEASSVGDNPGILGWGPQKAISSAPQPPAIGFLTSSGFLGPSRAV